MRWRRLQLARTPGPLVSLRQRKLDASNYYITQTELHALLAQAWEAAGATDSAATHYGMVARVWSAGDPPYRARADSARARVAALKKAS